MWRRGSVRDRERGCINLRIRRCHPWQQKTELALETKRDRRDLCCVVLCVLFRREFCFEVRQASGVV
jgi:hypothetical protein